jgi:hypothetical protein
LLRDRDEISNIYRGPSIDASYQVSVHLTKQFRRRRFLKIGQSETRIGKLSSPLVVSEARVAQSLDHCLSFISSPCQRQCELLIYRGPSIDASYQVSVHLTKQFRRRRFLKIGQSETRIACGNHVC